MAACTHEVTDDSRLVVDAHSFRSKKPKNGFSTRRCVSRVLKLARSDRSSHVSLTVRPSRWWTFLFTYLGELFGSSYLDLALIPMLFGVPSKMREETSPATAYA